MGAIARVRVHYSELAKFLGSREKPVTTVYGTFMEGENIYTCDLTSPGIVVLGNEGKGIHRELVPYIDRKITIPDFHKGSVPPDSLNVSMAAAIVISEFRRRSV
jgi:TrmH family RNA methyltransferase